MLRQMCRPKPLDPDKDVYQSSDKYAGQNLWTPIKMHIKAQTNMQAKFYRSLLKCIPKLAIGASQNQ